ncbi:hypothetical protein [Natronomonas salsuginis]|uniref:Uncharacterized protein n=1 Tax=Natronomonas salsuginis TaxID=2217661 RepID=A0A4U5JGU8_9EURY|nr:hypothetical protein [Natronomonas salsuginis]TKR25279.1 hypothetical protein DM868_10965 [Natronomonas salsuginis]
MTRTDPSNRFAYRSHDSKRLATYLRAEAERTSGDLYVNGDRLTDRFGRAPAEIDRLLRELSGSVPGLRLSLATNSRRVLWRVSRP